MFVKAQICGQGVDCEHFQAYSKFLTKSHMKISHWLPFSNIWFRSNLTGNCFKNFRVTNLKLLSWQLNSIDECLPRHKAMKKNKKRDNFICVELTSTDPDGPRNFLRLFHLSNYYCSLVFCFRTNNWKICYQLKNGGAKFVQRRSVKLTRFI